MENPVFQLKIYETILITWTKITNLQEYISFYLFKPANLEELIVLH